MVRVRQTLLKVTDDCAEQPRRETPRTERTGSILAHGRQLTQRGSRRPGHPVKLPPDLLAHRLRPVRGGQPGRLRGIGGGSQGMRPHVRNACRLPSRSSRGDRCGQPHLARRRVSHETTASLSNAKLAAGERP